jgi:hypothetical protein
VRNVTTAQAILEVREGLDRLAAAVAAADALLTQAEHAGMLVDEGRVSLREAREHQIHARVLVHAFAAKPFTDMLELGLASVRRAQSTGDEAMRELQFRRRGLAVATLVIAGFLVTLWLKIRRLPQAPISDTSRSRPPASTSPNRPS